MELKPGYKRTEIGLLPEDWDVTPLGQLISSTEYGSSAKSRLAGYTPVLRMGNLQDGKIDWANLVYTSDVTECNRYALRSGDVLFNRTNTAELVGKTAIYRGERPAIFAGYLIRIKTIPERLDPRFLNYILNAEFSRKHGGKILSMAVGQANINAEKLKTYPIPVPPTLTEQVAIANALDCTETLIARLDQLIAKKRDLKQAAMQELLTGRQRLPGFKGEWIERNLGEVISHCSSGATPYRGHPEYYTGKVKWITSGELNYNLIFDTIEHISEEAVGDTNLMIHPIGTFLMAITGLEAAGTRGACGIVGSPATTNQSCMAIYPTPALKSDYLYHYYVLYGNSLAFRYCQGTKQQSYTAALVRRLPIQMPPTVEEQIAIAAVLSDMDAEIAALKAHRDKTRAIKQGMMQELLTGKIRLLSADAATEAHAQSAASGVTTTPVHNWAINEAVVISVLAKTFSSDKFPLGRKRYTKLSYLLHRHVERTVQGYLKKAAGPYNPSTKYKGPEAIAQKNRYIRAHKNGQYSGFVAAEEVAKAEEYFEKWYGLKTLKWLELFRYKKNDDLEVLATVDMAMQDLRVAGAEVTLDAVKGVIRSHPEWEAKLDRPVFADASIATAMKESESLFA